MFWKKNSTFFQTTTFRLTLWYIIVFGGLSFLGFLIVYLLMAQQLQRHTDIELHNTITEFNKIYKMRGREALQAEFQEEMVSEGKNNVFFRLFDSQGDTLFATPISSAYHQQVYHLTDINYPLFQTIDVDEDTPSMRLVIDRTFDGNILEIGTTLTADELILERYRETFGMVLIVMLFLGGLFGFFLANKAMSGVKRVSEIAAKIGRSDFTHRVTVTNEGQEIVDLSHTFNEMLGRIETLLKELQQITDNVAHELRTPLTRIRGIAETTLKSSKHIDEFREMAGLVIEGSDELIEMINTMLEIAKTDSGVSNLNIEPLIIQEIIIDAVELFAPLACDKNITLHLSPLPPDITIRGDRSRLQRVVANLLDNAIKYTPSGGNVLLSLIMENHQINITISDTGSGIDKKDFTTIFDRFYRCDTSRSSQGSGLGLSLAQAIVHAHKGKITVSSDASGSIFTVLLPH